MVCTEITVTYLILLPNNLHCNIFHMYSFILYMNVCMYVCVHKYVVGLGVERNSGTCHGRRVKARGKEAGVLVSFQDIALRMEHFCQACHQALSPTWSSLVVPSGMVLNVKILVTCILITPPLSLPRSIPLFLPLFLPNFDSYFFSPNSSSSICVS